MLDPACFITDEYLRDVYRAARLLIERSNKTLTPTSQADKRLPKPLDKHDGDALKITLADLPSRPRSAIEQAFIDACEKYRHAVKRHLLFGDPLPIEAFSTAIDTFVKAYLDTTIDLLGKIVYVWPKFDDEGEKIGIFAQYFTGGRPGMPLAEGYANDKMLGVQEYENIEDLRAGFPQFSDYLIIERQAPKPYLYVLMRTDIGSMNYGKAIAQGTHAANQMVYEAKVNFQNNLDEMQRQFEEAQTNNTPMPDNKRFAAQLNRMVTDWEREANGFGTCICLGVNERQMRSSIKSAKAAGLHAGVTHDPSYPNKDGGTFYTIPLDTCAYILDYQAVVKEHVLGLELHP